ncbi:MAG: diguanylate cyclase [Candidatus Fermentithermobacillus carboniphilus]|uniref:Diguanylate cyclase n=1 Tax=Candidatus Fermentithermobacillus carboniphilus TaxID=3085328 RepID=A0AAT9LC88_9FIRM|nr:MAG: diguanylate cyclase [Candidatus Fermentithermobacillus carboniphilus]
MLPHKAFEVVVFIESQVKELGMSFGVAMFPADGDSLEDLLNIADRMLYRAKEKLS